MALPRKFLNEDEELLAELRPHWIFLFGPLFTSIGVWAALIVLLVLWHNAPSWTNYPILILALIPGLWLLGRFVRWRSYVVALTSTRILVREGIIGRDTVQLRLQRITEVNIRQRLIERVLGTGSLIIDVQGEDDSLTLEYMRKPAVVQRVINSQINEIVGGGRREAIPADMQPHDRYGAPYADAGRTMTADDTPPFGVGGAASTQVPAAHRLPSPAPAGRRHRRAPRPPRYGTGSSSSTTCAAAASSPRRSSPPRRASSSTASEGLAASPTSRSRNPSAFQAGLWEDAARSDQGVGRMHAHVVTVDITDSDAATKGLEELVPTVKASPGFVAGYWIRLDDTHGTSVAVFETEEQARAVAPPVGGGMGGVTITGVQIGEVLGSA